MNGYTSQTMNRAIELYQDGHSTRGVEELIGVNRQTVLEWVRGAGVVRDKSTADRLQNGLRNDKPYAALQKKAMALYVDEGMSSKEVAKKVGVSPSTVRRWLRHANLTRPHAQAMSLAMRKASGRQRRMREAYYMRLSGWRVKDIAAHFGVSPSCASVYLHDAKEVFDSSIRPGYSIIRMRINPCVVARQIQELERIIDLGQDSRCLLAALRGMLDDALDKAEDA